MKPESTKITPPSNLSLPGLITLYQMIPVRYLPDKWRE